MEGDWEGFFGWWGFPLWENLVWDNVVEFIPTVNCIRTENKNGTLPALKSPKRWKVWFFREQRSSDLSSEASGSRWVCRCEWSWTGLCFPVWGRLGRGGLGGGCTCSCSVVAVEDFVFARCAAVPRLRRLFLRCPLGLHTHSRSFLARLSTTTKSRWQRAQSVYRPLDVDWKAVSVSVCSCGPVFRLPGNI